MSKMSSSPFLELLTKENLKKIKIDRSLIPVFQEVMFRMDSYFQQNHLIEVRDWHSFFEKYLLTPSREQLSIVLNKQNRESAYCVAGTYSPEQRTITMYPVGSTNFEFMCANFCHEFIHFLVMHETNCLNYRPSDSPVLNEGMTECLTMGIMDRGTSSTYFSEIQLAKLYCQMNQNNQPVEHFLNNQFATEYNFYEMANFIIQSNNFNRNNSLSALLHVQRTLITDGLKNWQLHSFDELDKVLTIINNRPQFDSHGITEIFEMMIDTYLSDKKLTSDQKAKLKEKLMIFCELKNKAQLYGNQEVAECKLDDLEIAFDKQLHSYKNFPLSGKQSRGQIYAETMTGSIVVTHRDQEYRLSASELEYKNWKTIYDEYVQQIQKEIAVIEGETFGSMGPVSGKESSHQKKINQ